jgi:hypothetical protein
LKLARVPPSTYFGFKFPTIKYIDYVVKLKYKNRSVDCASSTSDRHDFRVTDLPVIFQPPNYNRHGKIKAIGEIPDFSGLRRKICEPRLALQLLTLEKLCNKASVKRLDEQYRTANLSSNPFLTQHPAPDLFQSDEDRVSAGKILLNHDILVACEYGRPKKLTVILFESRLVFLRKSASQMSIQYDLPIEYLLQITHRDGEAGTAVLTVFWDAEPDGPHEVAGAELFFHDMDRMVLWAGYLASVLIPR